MGKKSIKRKVPDFVRDDDSDNESAVLKNVPVKGAPEVSQSEQFGKSNGGVVDEEDDDVGSTVDGGNRPTKKASKGSKGSKPSKKRKVDDQDQGDCEGSKNDSRASARSSKESSLQSPIASSRKNEPKSILKSAKITKSEKKSSVKFSQNVDEYSISAARSAQNEDPEESLGGMEANDEELKQLSGLKNPDTTALVSSSKTSKSKKRGQTKPMKPGQQKPMKPEGHVNDSAENQEVIYHDRTRQTEENPKERDQITDEEDLPHGEGVEQSQNQSYMPESSRTGDESTDRSVPPETEEGAMAAGGKDDKEDNEETGESGVQSTSSRHQGGQPGGQQATQQQEGQEPSSSSSSMTFSVYEYEGDGEGNRQKELQMRKSQNSSSDRRRRESQGGGREKVLPEQKPRTVTRTKPQSKERLLPPEGVQAERLLPSSNGNANVPSETPRGATGNGHSKLTPEADASVLCSPIPNELSFNGIPNCLPTLPDDGFSLDGSVNHGDKLSTNGDKLSMDGDKMSEKLSMDGDRFSQEGDKRSDCLQSGESQRDIVEQLSEPEFDMVSRLATQQETDLVIDSAVPKKPRLMIKCITLENFKSYGAKRMIGPFDKNLTSVIGPNGSGKSNTIDALLFVFGKKAKQIRLNKVSELIHSSKGKENIASCKVEVFFQDIIDTKCPETGRNYQIIPGTELCVAREAFQNNSSTYYIDSRKSNFLEVTTLLKKRGIDLIHNRFLILQGEVEAISLMKPKAQSEHEDGFLEYLEDIIGSNMYKDEIAEKSKSVESISEIRLGKLNRLRAAEKEKEKLGPEKEEAERYVRMEKQTYIHKANLAQKDIFNLRQVRTGLEKDLAEVRELNEKHQLQMLEYQTKIEEQERLHNEELKTYSEVKQKMTEAQVQWKECENMDQMLLDDQEDTKNTLKQKTNEIQQKKQIQIDAAEQIRLSDATEIPKKEKELVSAENFLGTQVKNLEEAEAKVQLETNALREEKEKLEDQRRPLALQKGKLESEKGRFEVDRNRLHAKVTEAERKKENLTNEKQCMERRIHEFQADTQAKETRTEELKAILTEAKPYIAEKTKTISDLESDLPKLKERAISARNDLEAQKQGSQQQQAIKAESGPNGRLGPGILGRLGDLATIPEKYNIAATTAIGLSNLDSIVVESEDDAQRVLQFCREQNLGKVRCIILQKQEHLDPYTKKQTPKNSRIPRIIDLIKPKDPRLLKAFYFGFKDTLVAKDLDEATECSYETNINNGRRWKVVSLQGDIVDVSGALTGGGGASQLKAGFGKNVITSDFTEEQVQQMFHQVNEMQNQLRAEMEEKSQLEQALKEAEDEIREHVITIQRNSMGLEQSKKSLASITQQLNSIVSVELTAEEQQEVRKLVGLIAEKQNELGKIELKFKVLDDQITVLKSEIVNTGGDKIRLKKQAVMDAEKTVAKLKKEVNKLQADVQLKKKEIEQAVLDEKSLEEDVKEAKLRMESLKEQYKLNEEKAAAMTQAFNELSQQSAESDKKLTEYKATWELLSEEAMALKASAFEMETNIQKMEEKHRDCVRNLDNKENLLTAFRKDYKTLPLIEGEPGYKAHMRRMVNDARRQQKLKWNAEKLQEKLAQAAQNGGDPNAVQTGNAAAGGDLNGSTNGNDMNGNNRTTENPDGECKNTDGQPKEKTEGEDSEKTDETEAAEKAAEEEAEKQAEKEAEEAGPRNPIFHELDADDIARIDPDYVRAQLYQVEANLKQLKVPNLNVIKEYIQKELDCVAKSEDYQRVNAEREEKRLALDALKKARHEMFMAGVF